jgi:hypothetical protein
MEVELCGYLNKKGNKGLIKTFKRRWCRFKDGVLHYYETLDETESLGSVDITLSCSAQLCPESHNDPLAFQLCKPLAVLASVSALLLA